ncbi:hypothetical protein AMAG_02701 [Allomyces macrogynus ATCC 38327]|uniref:FZ domain-containing protein n=1 Tax=Allomyces macrogynus (strain ATCC 38327) TaxID=578462 RepID=A0A0L0S3G6_ALLM3|nr:hypothetical protein AMAG_02701 [Allomyces macrogynus ATCC 38327]|eukprot:KNE56934.1 hypothetical protein AMAG_02701 [Allomyces macrogynus ATCC 38327]
MHTAATLVLAALVVVLSTTSAFLPTVSAARPAHCAQVPGPLSFCPSQAGKYVAFPAISGPGTNATLRAYALSTDAYARAVHGNWTLALRAVDCRDDPVQRFSLFRTCADCATAYREWLCATLFPECVDPETDPPLVWDPNNPTVDAHNASKPLVHVRAAEDASSMRATALGYLATANLTAMAAKDEVSGAVPIGGIAELEAAHAVLAKADTKVPEFPFRPPCIDVCYKVVTDCPATLGFACPRVKGLVTPHLESVQGVSDPTAWAGYWALVANVFPDYDVMCNPTVP